MWVLLLMISSSRAIYSFLALDLAMVALSTSRSISIDHENASASIFACNARVHVLQHVGRMRPIFMHMAMEVVILHAKICFMYIYMYV